MHMIAYRSNLEDASVDRVLEFGRTVHQAPANNGWNELYVTNIAQTHNSIWMDWLLFVGWVASSERIHESVQFIANCAQHFFGWCAGELRNGCINDAFHALNHFRYVLGSFVLLLGLGAFLQVLGRYAYRKVWIFFVCHREEIVDQTNCGDRLCCMASEIIVAAIQNFGIETSQGNACAQLLASFEYLTENQDRCRSIRISSIWRCFARIGSCWKSTVQFAHLLRPPPAIRWPGIHIVQWPRLDPRCRQLPPLQVRRSMQCRMGGHSAPQIHATHAMIDWMALESANCIRRYSEKSLKRKS